MQGLQTLYKWGSIYGRMQIYIYIYICMSMCVCVCVDRTGRSEIRKITQYKPTKTCNSSELQNLLFHNIGIES